MKKKILLVYLLLIVIFPLNVKALSIDKNDITLSVKVVYDKDIAKEKYPNASEEELRKILWEQIKEINKSFPPYKYIKNMILTDEELIKTTTKKVKRQEEMKKILG